jgi:hypothetical protein
VARFAFCGPSYRSQSLLADCQTCMNWYLEAVESGVGRSAFVLYPTPGLSVPIYNLGLSPVRGHITVLGRTFAVAGTSLWEELAPSAVPNAKNWSLALGVNLPSDGLPVSMVGGGHQLLIVSQNQAFVFDLAANTLTAVDPSAGVGLPIAMVAFSDGFFFSLVENVAPVPWQINSSNLFDATTWQATNFTAVSVFSENPNCIFVNQRLLWVFGPTGIQPYSNTGNFPFPFDVIPGTFIENGLAAPFAVTKFDNSIAWLGSDPRGNGMVWRANGFTPQRISNHAIEYALQSYPTLADATCYAYQDQGHSFLRFDFPTADKTWVYDAATGQWHERGFWNVQRGAFNRHRAAFHTFNFGMHLVGDPTTGAAYQQSINIYSDFGNVIRRVRRAPHISKEQKRISHNRLQVDVETGLGPVAPPQGNQPATYFYLADPTGVEWQIGVTDLGVLDPVIGGAEAPAPFFLNDPLTNTSWQITINALGVLAVSISAGQYPAALQMTSGTGNTQWVMQVRQIAPRVGQIFTLMQGIVGRGPLMTLRWSDDGGKTFSNEHVRDCGQAGAYLTRVLWNRLGSPRDRVYEISVTDPVPWRIIDAYLDADGYQPSERLNKQIAKQA